MVWSTLNVGVLNFEDLGLPPLRCIHVYSTYYYYGASVATITMGRMWIVGTRGPEDPRSRSRLSDNPRRTVRFEAVVPLWVWDVGVHQTLTQDGKEGWGITVGRATIGT